MPTNCSDSIKLTAEVNTEGNFRCEILSEAPDFETVRKSKYLKVYGKYFDMVVTQSNARLATEHLSRPRLQLHSLSNPPRTLRDSGAIL